jgi:hypothetical protein
VHLIAVDLEDPMQGQAGRAVRGWASSRAVANTPDQQTPITFPRAQARALGRRGMKRDQHGLFCCCYRPGTRPPPSLFNKRQCWGVQVRCGGSVEYSGPLSAPSAGQSGLEIAASLLEWNRQGLQDWMCRQGHQSRRTMGRKIWTPEQRT